MCCREDPPPRNNGTSTSMECYWPTHADLPWPLLWPRFMSIDNPREPNGRATTFNTSNKEYTVISIPLWDLNMVFISNHIVAHRINVATTVEQLDSQSNCIIVLMRSFRFHDWSPYIV